MIDRAAASHARALLVRIRSLLRIVQRVGRISIFCREDATVQHSSAQQLAGQLPDRFDLLVRDLPGRPPRIDPQHPQDLGAIHVADARDRTLVEQHRADRDACRREPLREPRVRGALANRIRSEARDHVVACRFVDDLADQGTTQVDSVHGASKAYAHARARQRRRLLLHQVKTSSQAEMHVQPAGVTVFQKAIEQMLAVRLEAHDARAIDRANTG